MKTIAIAIAALLTGAAPAALAQPPQDYQGQSYGSPAYGQPAPPSPAPDYAPDASGYGQDTSANTADQNVQAGQQYDRSMDAYQAQLREYRRQRHEYERQRAAYEAQFGPNGSADAAYPPPVPPPPPPGAYAMRSDGPGYWRYSQTSPFQDGPWDGDRGGGWHRDHGCRLAAPDGGDSQMMPVCPDDEGRYRPPA